MFPLKKIAIVPNPHPRVFGTYNQELLTTLLVPDVTQWHCELHVRTEDTFLAHTCNYQQWRWLGSSVALGEHYSDVIMVAIASEISSLTIVYSIVYSGADQKKYKSSASLAYVRGIHWWPVNSTHKWPVTRIFFSNWWCHDGPEQRYPAAGAPPPFHQSVAGGRVTQMMNLIQQKWNEYTLYRKGSVITRNHIHIFHMFISTGILYSKKFDLSVIHSRLNMKLSKELGESKYCGIFLAATKQLCCSVRPSVRLSVCPPFTSFSLCSHHSIIMKFSGGIANDRGEVHAKGQGQRSKVKVTEVKTKLSRFRTVTLYLNSHMGDEIMHKAWWCLGEVPYCFSRSSVKLQGHTAKNYRWFWPKLGVSGL